MIVRTLVPSEKDQYNLLVTHPVQTWEWGEFRANCGVEVVRLGLFEGNNLIEGISATLHLIPEKMPIIGGYKVMYIPKCLPISLEMLNGIKKYAIENKVIFAKIEPNVWAEIDDINGESKIPSWQWMDDPMLVNGKASFATNSAIINLELENELLLANMKQKTRYNLKLAEKKGVTVAEDNSDEAFSKYLELTRETTRRQRFYAHSDEYHKEMWRNLHKTGIAKLLTARYDNKIITTWILFIWRGFLYYPYGASSREHQDVMANNLVMWQAIQLGKSLNLKLFDLWGTLGPDARENDPWYGFHKFKLGFGPTKVKFAESKDLVIDPTRYKLFNWSDKQRKSLLNLKAFILNKLNYPV